MHTPTVTPKPSRTAQRRQSSNTIVGRLLGLHAHMIALNLRAEAVAVENILAEVRRGGLR